jgi:galactokinase
MMDAASTTSGAVMTSARLASLRAMFEREFGALEAPVLVVAAPGRTEIAGNHTDHEGGTVIAGAVDRYVTGLFRPRIDHTIRLVSDGYEPIELDVEASAAEGFVPHAAERGLPAGLVRGLVAQVAEWAHTQGPQTSDVSRASAPSGASTSRAVTSSALASLAQVAGAPLPQAAALCGFDAVMTSDVPAGSGISSSAAFELAIAQALNHLWAGGRIAPLELATMSQVAEQDYFGKPCGLMDQAAVAVGGIAVMGFADAERPRIEPVDVDLADAGYALCLVATGTDHAASTDAYAAVPGEMRAVAEALGAHRLSEACEADVLAKLPELRAALGDRAPLRALHFFREERLTAQRAEALRRGDYAAFLELTRRSGASSAMYLQNVAAAGGADQPAMVALAVADELLDRMGEQSRAAGELGAAENASAGRDAVEPQSVGGPRALGAARIHGGGFGGTIQVFIEADHADEFCAQMDAALGCAGAATTYAIDHEGARAQWLQ